MNACAWSLFALLVAAPKVVLADERAAEAPLPLEAASVPAIDLSTIRAPAVCAGFALMLGLDGVSSSWSESLERVGRPDVVSLMGDIGTRAFFQFEGIELSLAMNLLFDGTEGSAPPATAGIAGTLFAELSYDAARSLLLTIGPTFGVGWLRSSFRVTGEATALPASAPAFLQVLADPGVDGTDLSADALLVRPGVVVGVALPMAPIPDGNFGFVNVRPSYSFVALETKYTAGERVPFEGPTLPHPAFAVAVEVGLTFGGGHRATGL